MINANALLSEQAKPVLALGSVVPASSSPTYVSMKTAPRIAIYILGINTTTVTGSAVTLNQATTVAGTSAKSLAFSTMRQNLDIAATDTLVDTAVTSNTFTTTAVNSKTFMYEITVDGSTLDTANSFDCIQVGVANATNTTLTILYMLYPCKYAKATPTSAILD